MSEMITSRQIRAQFLSFFESKKHLIVPSAPIVIKNDPTLLFTNSGMNQFKEIFLGEKKTENTRIADTQKCLRVSGKHNDLEEVGHDTYHHTMFEMLGNWSFGDYFKEEAIEWAWQLLTEVYKIPKDRLYVTVFGGDKNENLTYDQDAADYWKKWIDPNRILAGSKKDNFWEMGDTGPCGPCSEIHVDIRTDAERNAIDGKALVNEGHPQVIEIWNLVFMEFNRKADGSLHPLPAKHVDTGMGFERLCMVLQGKASTYDTDVFSPLKSQIERATGIQYGDANETDIAMRVVMDHIRAVAFAIADGQLPSNNGAGYVIRRVLRRASRYAFRYLNRKHPFLFELIPTLTQEMGDAFPELKAQQAFITRIIEEEEKGFLSKLEKGSQRFAEYVSNLTSDSKAQVSGDFAFELYDTFGFPVDLTALMAKEASMTLDEAAFEKNMQAQKARSRQAAEVKKGDWVELDTQTENTFTGYDTLEGNCRILKYRMVSTKAGEVYEIVLDKTPFYAESGGQVGDTGTLRSEHETLNILDTRKENFLIIHTADALPEKPDSPFYASVNAERRRHIIANHSATHLLHAALRQILGTHVEQRGSLVHPDYLRFDFSHFAKISDEELISIENRVNQKITQGIQLKESRSVAIEDAKNMGAMMLFGEKYGDQVRVIQFEEGFSTELCGGTHVQNTLEIRYFKILSESSAAAGIRRIEALTGDTAIAYLEDRNSKLRNLESLLKNPKDSEKALEELLLQQKETEKILEDIQHRQLMSLRDDLIQKAKSRGDELKALVQVANADALKTLSFELRKMTQGKTIILGALLQDKPMLSVILSEDIQPDDTRNASKIIRELAKAIQGGGGGQDFYATAGGKKAEGLKEIFG
jgi:alanyl-tRNA synthetase